MSFLSTGPDAKEGVFELRQKVSEMLDEGLFYAVISKKLGCSCGLIHEAGLGKILMKFI